MWTLGGSERQHLQEFTVSASYVQPLLQKLWKVTIKCLLLTKTYTSNHIIPLLRSVIEQHKTHCYGLNKFSSNSPRLSKPTKNSFIHLPRRQQVMAWSWSVYCIIFRGILSLNLLIEVSQQVTTVVKPSKRKISNHSWLSECFAVYMYWQGWNYLRIIFRYFINIYLFDEIYSV